MTKPAVAREVEQLREDLRTAQAKIRALEMQAGVLNTQIDVLLAAVQPILRSS